MVSGKRIIQPIAIPPVTVKIIMGFIELSMNKLSSIGVNVEEREPIDDIKPKLNPLTLAGNI